MRFLKSMYCVPWLPNSPQKKSEEDMSTQVKDGKLIKKCRIFSFSEKCEIFILVEAGETKSSVARL